MGFPVQQSGLDRRQQYYSVTSALTELRTESSVLRADRCIVFLKRTPSGRNS